MSAHNILQQLAEADHQFYDPGDAGAIAFTKYGEICHLVTAASETRTVSDPLKEGIPATIDMQTDGGDAVVTFATAYDEAGSTAMTFSATGQAVSLVSVKIGTAYAWRVVGYDGVAGPAVGLNIRSSSSAIVLDNVVIRKQAAPTAKTTAATLTIAELLTGILTGTHTAGATVAYTLPTGALVDAAVSDYMGVDEAFDWSLINLSAAVLDTITVTAAAGGHTVVGNMIVESAHADSEWTNSGLFRTRKTAADTFVTYRIG